MSKCQIVEEINQKRDVSQAKISPSPGTQDASHICLHFLILLRPTPVPAPLLHQLLLHLHAPSLCNCCRKILFIQDNGS